jgi:hypothetical protein
MTSYFFIATLERSARASRRLNFASWITPVRIYCQLFIHDPKQARAPTGISIAREVPGPLDECATFILPRGDWVALDRAENGRVGELRLRSDHAVGDEVVDGLLIISLVSQK